jgi:hypothetical protein
VSFCVELLYSYTVKKRKVFHSGGISLYNVHTTDDSLRSKRNIFSATHRVFLHEIGRDPFHQQGGNFSPQIGWEWGKIPTWWEKSLCGNGYRAEKIPTWSEKFRHGWKNSDMAGKKMGRGKCKQY